MSTSAAATRSRGGGNGDVHVRLGFRGLDFATSLQPNEANRKPLVVMSDPMSVNYSEAGRRHLVDCQALARQRRAGNASHLAGFAAECALKAVLQGLGHLTLNDKGVPEDRKHKDHIDKIWHEFQARLSGRSEVTYALTGPNPFDDWKIGQRYETDSTIDLATAEKHCAGAAAAMQLLDRARIEGVVR